MSVIDTTSKTSLKLTCLQACNNDIVQAEKLYRYIAEGLTSLPDTNPLIPTTMERVRMGADEVVAWIGSHRDELAQGISLIKGVSQRIATSVTPSIPPIPKI